MKQIAIVVKGYPRLSETFIAQELCELERRGLNFIIVSLRHPTDKAMHPIHREIHSPVIYLPEYLHHEPRRSWRGLRRARHLSGFNHAVKCWLSDLRRDITMNRIRRFGQAAVMATELPHSIQHYYAHFLHTPASVARYAALMHGKTWSTSAHAKDIWTTPKWELREKLAEADWAVTCTQANAAYLQQLSHGKAEIELLYHGLDFARFPENPCIEATANGQNPEYPVQILSVGRVVAKKGYDDLLEALALLPKNVYWRFQHIGGGPLLDLLKNQAMRLGLDTRIDWRGAQPQETVLTAYRQADVFVLPSRIANDGDRDGLPNVLLEAQSQSIACISTKVSGIPELVEDGLNGILVEPEQPHQLANALHRLITEPGLRKQLGQAGCLRVHDSFSMQEGIDRLFAKLSVFTA